MKTDPKENPQTADLEQVVKDVGLWDKYMELVRMMTDTAQIKFAHVPEENRKAFIKTCKYSYCAGVSETVRKFYDDMGIDEDTPN